MMFRKRPSHLIWKLTGLALMAGLLVFWVAMGWPCIPRRLTGIPCIGCGLSRAWLAALRLEFSAAFYFHPMFWSVPVLALFFLYDGELFRSRRFNRWCLGLMTAGWLVCYAIRLVAYLKGELIL